MPLSAKGRAIMRAMKREYGDKKGESVFYASKNKGTIAGVEGKKRKRKRHDGKMSMRDAEQSYMEHG